MRQLLRTEQTLQIPSLFLFFHFLIPACSSFTTGWAILNANYHLKSHSDNDVGGPTNGWFMVVSQSSVSSLSLLLQVSASYIIGVISKFLNNSLLSRKLTLLTLHTHFHIHLQTSTLTETSTQVAEKWKNKNKEGVCRICSVPNSCLIWDVPWEGRRVGMRKNVRDRMDQKVLKRHLHVKRMSEARTPN